MSTPETIEYKGFTITKDQIYGWSLIDRKGAWACSKTSIDKLKETVEKILKSEKDAH